MGEGDSNHKSQTKVDRGGQRSNDEDSRVRAPTAIRLNQQGGQGKSVCIEKGQREGAVQLGPVIGSLMFLVCGRGGACFSLILRAGRAERFGWPW